MVIHAPPPTAVPSDEHPASPDFLFLDHEVGGWYLRANGVVLRETGWDIRIIRYDYEGPERHWVLYLRGDPEQEYSVVLEADGTTVDGGHAADPGELLTVARTLVDIHVPLSLPRVIG